MKESGKMGNAGMLKEGFSIVSRDLTVSDTPEQDDDDDDFFAVSEQ